MLNSFQICLFKCHIGFQMPITFMDDLNTFLNRLKLLKKHRKPINSSFWPYWLYWVLWSSTKINNIFFNYNSYNMIWKVMQWWKILQLSLPWCRLDLFKIQIYVLLYLPSGHGLWKYLKFIPDTFRRLKSPAIRSMKHVATKYCNIWKNYYINMDCFH